jgi:hypothetical protein
MSKGDAMRRLTTLMVGAVTASLAVTLPGIARADGSEVNGQQDRARPGVSEAEPVVQRAGPERFFPKDSACLVFDQVGDPTWWGEESMDVTIAGDELAAVADAHRHEVAGVSLCSDRSGLAVFVANREAGLMAEIDAVADAHPSVSVFVEPAAAGAEAIMDAGYRLFEADPDSAITGFGVDVHTGGLTVDVQPSVLTRQSDPVTARSVHADVLKLTGLDLPIRVQPGAVGEFAADRTSDSAP